MPSYFIIQQLDGLQGPASTFNQLVFTGQDLGKAMVTLHGLPPVDREQRSENRFVLYASDQPLDADTVARDIGPDGKPMPGSGVTALACKLMGLTTFFDLADHARFLETIGWKQPGTTYQPLDIHTAIRQTLAQQYGYTPLAGRGQARQVPADATAPAATGMGDENDLLEKGNIMYCVVRTGAEAPGEHQLLIQTRFINEAFLFLARLPLQYEKLRQTEQLTLYQAPAERFSAKKLLASLTASGKPTPDSRIVLLGRSSRIGVSFNYSSISQKYNELMGRITDIHKGLREGKTKFAKDASQRRPPSGSGRKKIPRGALPSKKPPKPGRKR